MITIETRTEHRRGCGWRKPGGLYLVSDSLAQACGRLPIPLDICPTCGGGIHAARGWTWVNATALAATKPCPGLNLVIMADIAPGQTLIVPAGRLIAFRCSTCPLGGPLGRAGLLWVGGVFYPTPAAFTLEAARQGVSRRIAAIPKGLHVGETWVLLAHRRAIRSPDGTFTPAVFHAFRPKRLEYVVRPDDPPAQLARLADRGVTLVRVERHLPAPLLEAQAQEQSQQGDLQ